MRITITLFGFKLTNLQGKKDLTMTWLNQGTVLDVAAANQHGLDMAASGLCDSYLVETA